MKPLRCTTAIPGRRANAPAPPFPLRGVTTMKRALLHLDTEPIDARTLRWAHEAGLTVIATGRSQKGLEHAHIDRFQELEPQDQTGLLNFASQLDSDSLKLVGAFSSQPGNSARVAELSHRLGLAVPSPEALRRAANAVSLAAELKALGLPHKQASELSPRARQVRAQAYFRDGDFVRGGLQELISSDSQGETFGFLGHLEAALEDELYALVENAARALALDAGPITADLALDAQAQQLVGLRPGFDDSLMGSYLAPLALGKSPIQAWFAALAEAGGPFDAMPQRTLCCAGRMLVRAEMNGTFGELNGLERVRTRQGIEGARALVRTGSPILPGTAVAVIWAVGDDALQVRGRLQQASRYLEPSLQETSAA